jgi:uncharacterized protein YndB with AHSA1/START domain
MLSEATTSTPARLVLEGTIAGAGPEEITEAFTDPAAVTKWWADEATVAEDGTYAFSWPAQEWTLRGRFLEVLPGHRVRFTWAWDHERLVAAKTVLVTVTAVSDGTMITITHGDYGPDDEEERRGHLEGWQYFIGRLADHLR